MTTMWGIHNDTLGTELLDKGFIAIGWEEMGDLRLVGDSQTAMRAALERTYPSGKLGAFPVWAGILRRFAFEMRPGDQVVAPYKPDSTLSFGIVEGDYEYHPEAVRHPNRRRVRWVRTGVARGHFSQAALWEVGSALTLFQVRTHPHEFAPFFAPGAEEPTPSAPQPAAGNEDANFAAVVAVAQDEPNADRIDQHTRDFVLKTLLTDISAEDFEHFTADLLRTMGYQARVTRFVADGGVDVVAHKDPLGLEPPVIKVQCKHTASTLGRPEVQQLIGTLAHDEVGLFVSLGSYSREALDSERERRTLRLFAGADVTSLVIEHYESLPARWRALMPLRRLLVVDRGPD